MPDIYVRDFSGLHQALSPYGKDNLWIFRGQGSPRWNLMPKAGREPYKGIDDELFFKAWKRRAAQFIEAKLESDWDWLSIAQHYGLATRLLDWTHNPLIAAFFAVENSCGADDAAIYAYYSLREADTDEYGPFSREGVEKVRPNGVARRIVNQSCIFTVHNPPGLSLERSLSGEDRLERIILGKDYLVQLKFELSYYGVNQFTLFPDLDGLSRHANWHVENRRHWKNESSFYFDS